MGEVKREDPGLVNITENGEIIKVRDCFTEWDFCTSDGVEVNWGDIAVRAFEQLFLEVVEGGVLFKPDVELVDEVEAYIVEVGVVVVLDDVNGCEMTFRKLHEPGWHGSCLMHEEMLASEWESSEKILLHFN